MPGIVLHLMGPPTVELPSGAPTQALRASKCLALLAFLALEPGPHSRESLATLLWSDSTDAAARTSLRQALKQLRDALGDRLRTDRQSVELTGDVECDVTSFLLACEKQPADVATVEVERFMAEFVVPRAPAFEEWLDGVRARLRAKHAQALRSEAERSMAISHWREAAGAAERWLSYEPLSDEAARVAIEAEYMAGNRAEALALVRAHRERLAREARMVPSASLETLMRRVEKDQSRRPARAARTGEATPSPSFQSSLIGRERQWSALREAWNEVEDGHGRVALLEGEVGLGKTRLAEDWLRWARAEGATVLRGRGYDVRAGTPYAPIVEALRGALDAPGLAGTDPEYLTEVTRLLPELRRRFPGLAEPAAPTDAADKWRLFEAVAQAVLAVASEDSTVLLVDDLQWCDGETCALLHFLARRLEAAPVLVLATVRLGDLERDAPAARLVRSLRARDRALVVTMTPLGVDDVWRLVREVGHIQSPDGARRFATRLHEVTDGNPFHVIELLKTLFAQGAFAVQPDSGEWVASRGEGSAALPMPQTVREAIAERVAQLPYQHRDLLATIAVSGSGCRTVLLSHAHGISRLQAAALCDALVDKLLLSEEDGVYRCAHPVIAAVVRDTLTASRRREVHRAIAFAIEAATPDAETPDVAGEIARHADRGGERAMAWHYATMACDQAVRRYAFDEALTWLDLASGVAEDGEQTETVNRRTADILSLAGWTEPPRRQRRSSSALRSLLPADLDLE